MKQNKLELLKNEMVRNSTILVTKKAMAVNAISNRIFPMLCGLLLCFIKCIYKYISSGNKKKQSSFICSKNMLLHISDMHSIITVMFRR